MRRHGAPTVHHPACIHLGQNAGNLKMAKAEQRRQVALYEKGVQKAFQEVSDTLTGRETYLRQDQHLTRLVAASRKAYDLAMMRYKSGIDPYLTTLTQQRTLYLAQRNLIMVQTCAISEYRHLISRARRRLERERRASAIICSRAKRCLTCL